MNEITRNVRFIIYTFGFTVDRYSCNTDINRWIDLAQDRMSGIHWAISDYYQLNCTSDCRERMALHWEWCMEKVRSDTDAIIQDICDCPESLDGIPFHVMLNFARGIKAETNKSIIEDRPPLW